MPSDAPPDQPSAVPTPARIGRGRCRTAVAPLDRRGGCGIRSRRGRAPHRGRAGPDACTRRLRASLRHRLERRSSRAARAARDRPRPARTGLRRRRQPRHPARPAHQGARRGRGSGCRGVGPHAARRARTSSTPRSCRSAATRRRRSSENLRRAEQALAAFARAHRGDPAAARTLTQHGVPTTLGAEGRDLAARIVRARRRLSDVAARLPAQLGGAGGTLASFDEIFGADAAADLPAPVRRELGLPAPDAPWHTDRWPVTELGDALAPSSPRREVRLRRRDP